VSRVALIGGSGLSRLNEMEIDRRESLATPYGAPSADLTFGRLFGHEIVFLARHGDRHTIPPHKINYRANIWALKQSGVAEVLAIAAVGGIHCDMEPGRLVIPDHIIDYTHGRPHTFFEDDLDAVTHIDFTQPYSARLRVRLIEAAEQAGLFICRSGTYGCTQGPRLETAAEVCRMERDGCDLVGMTGMPEAALARELRMDYACCAVVVNWAAGKTETEIRLDEIMRNMEQGMQDVIRLLRCIAAAE
jgi:5'-methylthioinosine phosphorylase